jgi:dienelactone hydrolase
MNFKTITLALVYISLITASCNSNPQSEQKTNPMDKNTSNIIEQKITYQSNGKTYDAFVTYDGDIQGPRPGILVVPEWWGLNDYTRSRAKQLAGLGYVAMALDVYGDGKQGNTPEEAGKLASTYYNDLSLSKIILDAALNKFKTYPQVDSTKMGAIGYCFGGALVLNAAKLGIDLKGVVSFHGGLQGVTPDKSKIKAKILVCHGAADEFENPHVAQFKKEMDSAGVDYTFKEYANATHAFSNPIATEVGKKFNMPIAYNEAADKASWEEMKNFFKNIF